MTEPELLERLRRLDVCALSDAVDALGLPPAVTGLARRSGGRLIAGRVSTVTLAVGPAPAGAPKVHLCARAIDAARRQGVEGVVVDGPTRDIDEAIGLGFPVFARGATARTARGRIHETATDAAVTIDGMRVEAGDYVVADGSGVAFIAAGQIEQVLGTAERIAAKERLMTEAVRGGKPVSSVMGADYETMLEGMR